MSSLIILTLLQIPNIGRKTIQAIFANNPQNNMPNSINELRDFLIEVKYYNHALRIPENDEINAGYNKAQNIVNDSMKHGVNFVSFLDDEFPKKLKDIPDAPVLLFYKGNYDCINEPNSIAVVGTREPTEHGIRIAERLGVIFAERGFVVVSGLAIGCDSYGHRGCINAKGKSIAVMPCGLDKVYPSQNKELAENILSENGCLVSEYPIGVKPFRNYFVERDRLQSGLSKAVVIVETDVKGGTLHTARFCQEQKRVLVCYKHPQKYLNENKTKGNQMLISQGKAISISNELDIEELVNKIKTFNYTYTNNTDNNDNFEQMKFI